MSLESTLRHQDVMRKLNLILDKIDELSLRLARESADNIEQFSNQSMLLNELSVKVQELEDKK